MIEKKKKIIFIGIVLILVILIVVILNNINKKENTKIIETVNLAELINEKEIEKLAYEKEESKEKISSKYITNQNKYEIKAKVMAEEIEGKMIYIRGTQNLNVYKTTYTLNRYKDKTTEISNIIQEFEMTCERYMEITNNKYEKTEQLYGESTVDYKRPIEESIYFEKRLYSKTYQSEENKYDINFYREDNKIICEFVHYIE